MATTLILRASKGSPLTNAEMDDNFSNLRATADQALAKANAATSSGGTGGSGTSGSSSVSVGSTFPTPATEGDLFYNTTEDQLYVYVGSAWVTASVAYTPSADGLGLEIVSTLPADGVAGQVVYCKSDDKLYEWSGSAWVAAVPVIESTQITDGSITTPKLAANSVTADKIVANAITAGKIAAGAIGASQISSGAITTDKLAANSITAGKIASGAITAASLSASSASATVSGVNFWLGGSQTVMGYPVCFHLDRAAGGNIPMVVSTANAPNGTAAFFFGPGSGSGDAIGAYGQVTISGPNATWKTSARLAVTNYGDTNRIGVEAVSWSGGVAGMFVYCSNSNGTTVAGSPANVIARNVAVCNSTYGIQMFGSTVGTFTGAHDATYKKSSPVPEIGDIVIDVGVVKKTSVNEVLTEVAMTDKPNDKRVVGVVSDFGNVDHIPSALAITTFSSANPNEPGTPSTVLDPVYEHLLDDHTFAAINAVGEGLINVCGLNGDIDAGDLIVSSSMLGKGMKQDDDIMHSYTVAKARESVQFASADEVKQIACTYHCG